MARSRRPNPFCISLHAAPHRLVRSFQTRRLRHLRAERGTRPAAFQNLAHRPARSDLPLCLRRLALALAHGILRRDRNRSTGLSGQCRRLGERRHEERRRRCGVDARGDDRRQPAPARPPALYPQLQTHAAGRTRQPQPRRSARTILPFEKGSVRRGMGQPHRTNRHHLLHADRHRQHPALRASGHAAARETARRCRSAALTATSGRQFRRGL